MKLQVVREVTPAGVLPLLPAPDLSPPEEQPCCHGHPAWRDQGTGEIAFTGPFTNCYCYLNSTCSWGTAGKYGTRTPQVMIKSGQLTFLKQFKDF